MYDQPNALYRCTPVLSIDPIGEKVETVSKKFEPGTINRFYRRVIPIPRNGNYQKLSSSVRIRLPPPPVEKTKRRKTPLPNSTLFPHSLPSLSHPTPSTAPNMANIARPCARSSPIEIQSFPERDAHSVSFFFRAWTWRRRYELPTFLTMQNDSTSGGCLLQAGGLQRAEKGGPW